MRFAPILAAIILTLSSDGGAEEEKGAARFLWISFGGLENNDLKGLICPGTGNFAVKKPGVENCQKYFDCYTPFKAPSGMYSCAKDQTFNRISRTCVAKEFANCKWCSKEGRHADKTSKHHFIECVAGSVGIRYKCRNGKYDNEHKGCKNSTLKEVTDVTRDVDYDPPTDIAQFMKDWKEAEKEEKEDKKTVDTSIEQPAIHEESHAKGKGKGKGHEENEEGEEEGDKKKHHAKNKKTDEEEEGGGGD